MPQLTLDLLGPPRLACDGRPLAGSVYDHVRALLIYLAVEHDRPHPREALAALLWPDQPEPTARRNLRQALLVLRQAAGPDLGDGLLLADRRSVQLHPAARVALDVRAFLSHVDAVERHGDRCDACLARLEEAVALYRGDFLGQFLLRNSALFDEWAALTRERLARAALWVLDELCAGYAERGDYAAACHAAHRRLELEPWSEHAHRQLMELLWRGGDRGRALLQYERCRRMLADELGVEPAAETVALEGRIRAGDLPHLPAPADGRPAPPAAALPLPLTPLVGRADDLAALTAQLCDSHTRLVTLLGPPGVGKTRLSLHAAEAARAHFADGALFVAMAPLADPTLVLGTIAEQCQVQEQAERPLLDLLCAQLAPRRTLLILDNFEHVRAAAPLVVQLLRAAPRLTVLVTSRVALRVSGEQLFPLAPLALPDSVHAADPDSLSAAPAVQLFVQRLRAARPRLTLTPEQAAAIADICARLDGLPLGIELAAARVALFGILGLRDRLRNALSLAVGGPDDIPQRQRTLDDAIAWSYTLLRAPEQRLFRWLGLFAGSWSIDLLTAVYRHADGVDQPVLPLVEMLLTHSLVHPVYEDLAEDGPPRFAMLETIRVYAVEQLEASGETEAARLFMAEVYSALVERAGRAESDGQRAAVQKQIRAEHANLRSVLAWTLDIPEQHERGAQIAAGLADLWFMPAYGEEGLAWLERALASPHLRVATRAALLLTQGWLLYQRGAAARAARLLDTCAASFREVGDTLGRAVALTRLGAVLIRIGDDRRAADCLSESAELFKQIGDRPGEAAARRFLAGVAAFHGDLGAAARDYEVCIKLARAAGNLIELAWGLCGRGEVALLKGDDRAAHASFTESLALFQQSGDTWGVAAQLHNLGVVALRAPEAAQAAGHFAESLTVFRQLGNQRMIAECLAGIGSLALHHREPARAAGLLALSQAIAAQAGVRLDPHSAAAWREAADAAERRLGAGKLVEALQANNWDDTGAAIEAALAYARAIRDTA